MPLTTLGERDRRRTREWNETEKKQQGSESIQSRATSVPLKKKKLGYERNEGQRWLGGKWRAP